MEELKKAIDNPDFLAVSGSRLYGTDRPSSDWDFRGFCVPPYEYLIGLKNFEMGNGEGEDHKIFSIKRFFDLIKSGDPQATELLFAPEDKIVSCNCTGKVVLENRELFLSNTIYRRIIGYGFSEWRKAMGQKMVIEKRSKTLDDIIASVRNTKILDKDKMDQFVYWMEKDLKKTILPSKKDLGKKRKDEFKKFGYGVSSATHSIRLTSQLTELMTEGKMTFPRPEKDLLRDIRSGSLSREEVQKVYDEKVKLAKRARDNSVLPDKVNIKKIHNLYKEIISPFIANGANKYMKGI